MTHTHTHTLRTSILGFQLDSIATMGRMVREQQGERVDDLYCLTHVSLTRLKCSAQVAEECGGKRVCGEGIMRNHHESKSGKGG